MFLLNTSSLKPFQLEQRTSSLIGEFGASSQRAPQSAVMEFVIVIASVTVLHLDILDHSARYEHNHVIHYNHQVALQFNNVLISH